MLHDGEAGLALEQVVSDYMLICSLNHPVVYS